MKKIIFTLMLAIAGSVWTISSALCIARAPQSLKQSAETYSGVLVLEGTPCESTDTLNPCLPCLTLAFQSNETLYYLTSDNDQMMSQLDDIEAQFIEGQHATITGIFYQQGSYNYIKVQNISLDSDPLPSLCDEWHMLVPGFSWPYKDYTYMHHLANDTLIGGQHYVQLESNETGTFAYEGAMRESESKVYYIPAGSTHEYLLYDFNVQVGDTLTNLWIGGQESEYEQGLIRDIIVEDIEGTAPSRKFYISFTYDYWQGMFRWIEGVGLNEGPAGWYYVPGTPVDPTPEILCAYKDGKRVYAASQADNYDCCRTGEEQPKDTIPLFAQDDPGSSTVDPVDPNQVVATLQGDQLTIHEKTGVDVTYSLHHNAPAQTPSQHRAPQSNTFRNEVTIQITESGEYLLQLTNPSWGYTIVGRFTYVAEGIELTNDQLPMTIKVIKDGRLLIRRGEKIYTITGQQIQ